MPAHEGDRMCGSLNRLVRKLQGRAGRMPADAAFDVPVDACAGLCPDLGTYLVGAISPRDRAILVGHLGQCERCRDELAGLAALPGLLRRAPRPDLDTRLRAPRLRACGPCQGWRLRQRDPARLQRKDVLRLGDEGRLVTDEDY